MIMQCVVGLWSVFNIDFRGGSGGRQPPTGGLGRGGSSPGEGEIQHTSCFVAKGPVRMALDLLKVAGSIPGRLGVRFLERLCHGSLAQPDSSLAPLGRCPAPDRSGR